jgi:DNA polymerase III subunit epsilon
MTKEIYIDTETTGLDPCENGIWQIAGMIIVGEKVAPFNYKMKPFHKDKITDQALEMSRMTEDEMRNLADPKAVHAEFLNLLETCVNKFDRNDKYIFYGYNAKFDSDFLREWFGKCGDKYFGSWFYTPPVDIMAVAAFHLAEKRHELENFKLGTVVEYLGLKINREGEFHAADIDILYTYELAQYLRRNYPKREL